MLTFQKSSRTLALLMASSVGSLCCAQQPASSSPQISSEQKELRQYPLGVRPDSTPLYEELKRAYELARARKLDEAAAGYRSALEKSVAAQDQPAMALAHSGLSYVFEWKADYQAARKEGQQALALFQSLQNPVGAAYLNNRLGMIAYRLGDNATALKHYTEALKAFDALEMLRDKAEALRAVEMAGAPDGKRLLEESLAIARQIGDKPLEAAVLQSMGDNFFNNGQLDEAHEALNQAITLLQGISDTTALPYVLTSEGRVQRAHGHPEKSLELYQQALALQKKNGDNFGALQSTNALAVTYGMLGDHKTAIRLYEEALGMAKETGSARLINFAQGNLAGAYNNVGRYEDALAILEELVHKGTEHADYRYNSIGYANLHLGRLEKSIESFSKAIDLSRKSRNWNVLIQALPARAEAEEKAGKADAAMADAQEALRVIEDLRAHLVPSDFMKQGFAENSQDAYGLDVRLLEHADRAGHALEIAEEARSRAFLDLLGTHQLQSRVMTSQTRARSLKSAISPSDPANAIVMRGGRSLGPAEKKLQAGADSDLESLASVQPFALHEIQATARRLNSTILSYWVTADGTYIWLIPADGDLHTAEVHATWKDLERLIAGLGPGEHASQKTEPEKLGAQKEQDSTARRHIVARGGTLVTVSASKNKNWRELYRMLIEPIEAWLPAQSGSLITIEPHGPLLMLPFAALTDSNGRYFLERFSLNYTPAISLLQFTEKEEAEVRRLPPHYLLVADPSSMPKAAGESALPALPGSRREVAAVARLLPPAQVTLLQGRQAAEKRVSSLAAGNTVIHLATHGIIRDDQPFDSYLALGASAADANEDGKLTAQKIYSMDLHADLVFLSACRSGQGKISGDGLVGLTRAFWYAGAPSVVASLWDVADEPTYRMVSSFYQWRLKGSDKSRALRSAQLHLLQQLRAGRVSVNTPAGEVILPEDPIFWAGFVLQGEP